LLDGSQLIVDGLVADVDSGLLAFLVEDFAFNQTLQDIVFQSGQLDIGNLPTLAGEPLDLHIQFPVVVVPGNAHAVDHRHRCARRLFFFSQRRESDRQGG